MDIMNLKRCRDDTIKQSRSGDLSNTIPVTLEVYNESGPLVKVLVNAEQRVGCPAN